MVDKKNKNKNLRKPRTKATTSEARLIENPETLLPRDFAEAVDDAQEAMNDLYRKNAEYGDGSCAFMVMKEHFEGGVGNPPKSLKKGTLHQEKCRQSIKAFQRRLEWDRAKLPSEAQEKIESEIQKMNEALQWAQDFQNGEEPEIPKWARAYKEELGQ